MNYRQSDQRGIIYPVPVSLNNGQGLQEMILDDRRERIYITNAGYNRVEVFDTKRQRFLRRSKWVSCRARWRWRWMDRFCTSAMEAANRLLKSISIP